jgi:hypothetical protein
MFCPEIWTDRVKYVTLLGYHFAGYEESVYIFIWQNPFFQKARENTFV